MDHYAVDTFNLDCQTLNEIEIIICDPGPRILTLGLVTRDRGTGRHSVYLICQLYMISQDMIKICPQ